LQELNTYKHDIMTMEQSTISEIHSYQRPPACVHDVMASTYMLLGHPEPKLTVSPVCSIKHRGWERGRGRGDLNSLVSLGHTPTAPLFKPSVLNFLPFVLLDTTIRRYDYYWQCMRGLILLGPFFESPIRKM
jgi:hypothetical protein